jgi:hypothetical protein
VFSRSQSIDGIALVQVAAAHSDVSNGKVDDHLIRAAAPINRARGAENHADRSIDHEAGFTHTV